MHAPSLLNNRDQISRRLCNFMLKSRQRTFRLSCGAKWVARTANRAASLLLVLAILCSSTPAAPKVTVGLAQEWKTSFSFWLGSSGTAAKVKGWFTGAAPSQQHQERQDERDIQVSRIQIYPGDVTIKTGQTVIFDAVAYDYQDSPVGGIRFTWRGHDVGRDRAVRVSKRGDFKPREAGTYTITAESAGRQAQVTVTAIDDARRDPGQEPQATPTTRQVSSRDLPSLSSAPKVRNSGRHSNHARSRSPKFIKASTGRAATATVPMPLPQEANWDGGNYWSADDPGNEVGNPVGGPEDDGAGSGNFQLAAPVLGLPGRGIDLSLGLAYNSRLWNKANSEISYDIDRGWPAPGWSLGFGKIVGLGVFNGSMIVDADGTRHSFSGTVTVGPNQNYTDFAGHTTDGTFIDYTHHTGIGGAMTYAQAKYPNGVVIEYTVQGYSSMYPSRITDANGNYITITYVNNQGPQIQTITDTLGRVVNFHYDINNLLTAITAPGLTTGTTRTLVRLHYKQLTLNYGFSGLTPRVTNSTPWVVDAIYYPGTSTGYWFGDADSYSSYGMIARVREQRGMTLTAGSLTGQGTVTKGTETSESAYNYPLTPNSTLTDAPTYTTRTDTWDGMDTAAAVTNYFVQQNATPRRTEVTLPNGTKSVQLSFNTPGQFTDGLIYQDETYGSGSTALLQKSTSTWEPGAYDSPRPARVETFDERNQKKATEFDYGASYNQVTEVRNYDYGGTALLQATRTQYQNSTSYTSRHIFNLPLVVEVFAANNITRVSRTEYQYDGLTLVDTLGVVMHHDSHNPYAPEYLVPGECCEWDPNYYQLCLNYCPDYYTSDYDPSTDYRGNVTQIKTFSDAAALAGAITETRTYDINGNMVTASTACCEQTRVTYTSATQYAYPTSQTRGSATNTAQQVTTSATYSFNTGLLLSTTDANSRTTATTYLVTNLRPQKITLPTGAFTSYAYDDSGMVVTETTYLSGGTVIASKNIKRLNGLGQVSQEEALTRENSVDYWDLVETTYDMLGRVWKQTMPYRSGETPQWSETFYDALGRVSKTKAPDGSESKAFYNEATRPVTATTLPGQTVRSVDAWGKERWGRTDARGRLVEVVEPDPAGNGMVQGTGASALSLVTEYTYDTLGNLTLVEQGSQLRKFKYDSLGRLTHQKLAEQSAMLNDAGTYVTSGGLWSNVFSYDTRSNLISRVDARGVETNFNYANDPLNRLQSVSYDTTGFGDTANPILPAATVSYTYMTTGDRTRIDKVTTTGISSEDYAYDTEGRLSSVTLTFTNRTAYPQVTDYTYDTLHRVTDVRYPAEYGNGTQPRKVVHHDFDVASRLSGVKVDNVSHASSLVYNPASQTTSLKVGAGTNQITESYAYEALTGLLSNQKVQRGATTLLDLSYNYLRAGTTSGRTGQLTKITNHLDSGRDRGYEYDALGKLKKATGGSTATWTQTYTYDKHGNRTGVTATGMADNGTPIPRDGFAALAVSVTTNQITTTGWLYDKAGNQVRAQSPGGGWQRYQYDAANRLVKVKADDNLTVLASYAYGDSNERLMVDEGGLRTYYACDGKVEYTESGSDTSPGWSKSYVYLGGRLLSTLTPNGSGGEFVQYHHPDRLGTRLVSNAQDTTSFEQVALPFGTALNAESTGSTNRRFTTYDRSVATGLDYAINRHYDSQQGRFTQVDPIGMRSVSLTNPQTLNLYAYCANDPVNQTDPSGLGFFSWIGKVFKKIWKVLVVVAIVVAVLVLIPGAGAAVFNVLKSLGGSIWSGIKGAASAIWSGLKSVGHSLKSLFTNQKFGLLAHLQDPLPAAPPGYEWIGGVLHLSGGGPIISASVTVSWTPVMLATGGAAAAGTAAVSAATGGAAAPASQTSTATPNQATKPCNRARGTGQGDINISVGTGPVSPTGGVMMNADQVHLYGGAQIGFSPLPVDGSIMVRNGTDIATGLNYNLQAGSVIGFSYSGRLNVSSLRAVWHSLKNGQFAFGGMTPGATASVVYVSKPWNIPCLTN